MIFYIIIGQRSNKIQSLLDIDEFFSFFFKKTQFYFYFLFFEKNCPLKMGSTNIPPPLKKIWRPRMDTAASFFGE
jgi:hypothetical protein